MTELHLAPMPEEVYGDYHQVLVRDYAKDKVAAGTWAAEEADKLAIESIDGLLPDGVRTENHHLFSIETADKGQKIGYFWVFFDPTQADKEGFIYDFLVFEELRGQGFGGKALESLNLKAKELGMKKISLHVFGHNRVAIGLYNKLGFETTDISMTKTIN